jgi:succinate dehydrogenase / fumarate reductase cytochrome b subunit
MSKTSSIVRKLLMALTGFFLMVFLLQHLLINMLSVISPEMFNSVSLFMGTNPVVQFAMQPILMFSVVFHFIWGMKLELENRSSRPIKYAVNNGAANSTWMSRNMLITGVLVLMVLALHFYYFWIPEVKTKFIDGNWTGMHDGGIRFYEELVHKFQDPIRVGLYVLAFISLALHLLHGFQSAFQTVGFNHTKYTPIIKLLGNVYAILIPLGFAFVAIFHFLAH